MHQAASIDTATLARRLKKDEQKNAHKRRHERHTTFIVAQMIIMDTGQRFDGVINELSVGGLRFRPASRYLQRRGVETVTVMVEHHILSARIRASRPDGYGLELLEQLTPDVVGELLKISG